MMTKFTLNAVGFEGAITVKPGMSLWTLEENKDKQFPHIHISFI